MNCWVQHADFSAEDFNCETKKQALDIFQTIDWIKENKLFSDAEALKKESCPPGFGVISNNYGILHICPDENMNSLVHYHQKRPIRILGLTLFNIKKNYSIPNVNNATCTTLIELFFDDRIQELVSQLK